MGTIASRLSRPLKNWNAENRAHRVISKEKPTAAPTYESTYKQIEIVDKLAPEYKEESKRKNPQLDNFLKQVYVRSNTAEIKEIDSRSDPDRPLPKDRKLHEGFEYGFYEPLTVPEGRVSLRQALQFISNHSKDPQKYSVETIAAEHKLKPKVVADILEYYRLFQVCEPGPAYDDDAVATSVPISLKSGIRVPQNKKKIKIPEKSDEEPKKHKQIKDK